MKVLINHLPASTVPRTRKSHKNVDQRSRHTIEYLTIIYIANSYLLLNANSTHPNDTKKMGTKDSWLDFWQILICLGGASMLKELLTKGDDFGFEFRKLLVQVWTKVGHKQVGKRTVPGQLNNWVRTGSNEHLELLFIEFVIDGLFFIFLEFVSSQCDKQRKNVN